MPDRPRVSLDNPVFRGRLSQTQSRTGPTGRAVVRPAFGPRVTGSAPVEQALPSIPAPAPIMAPSAPITAPVLRPTAPPRPYVAVPEPVQTIAPPLADLQLLQADLETLRLDMQPSTPFPQNTTPQQAPASYQPSPVPQIIAEVKTAPRRSKRNLKKAAIILLIIGVITAGSYGLFTKLTGKSLGGAPVITAVAETPESKPTADAVGSYRVAPEEPQFITIPKIFVYARVRANTLDANNQLQAPVNIFDTSWFSGSAKPGVYDKSGSTVIGGTAKGPTRPGGFKDLDKLVAGDIIRITRGDGKVINYTVVKIQANVVAPLDLAAAKVPAIAGQHGLNLFTFESLDSANGTEPLSQTVVYAVKS